MNLRSLGDLVFTGKSGVSDRVFKEWRVNSAKRLLIDKDDSVSAFCGGTRCGGSAPTDGFPTEATEWQCQQEHRSESGPSKKCRTVSWTEARVNQGCTVRYCEGLLLLSGFLLSIRECWRCQSSSPTSGIFHLSGQGSFRSPKASQAF